MPVKKQIRFLFWILITFMLACGDDDKPDPPAQGFQLVSIRVGTQLLKSDEPNVDMPTDQPVVVRFSVPLDTAGIRQNIQILTSAGDAVSSAYSFLDNDKTVSVKPVNPLDSKSDFTIKLSENLKGADGSTFPGLVYEFSTLNEPLVLEKISIDGKTWNSSPKMTEVSLDFGIQMTFSHPVAVQDLNQKLEIIGGGQELDVTIQQTSGDAKEFEIKPVTPAVHLSLHNVTILDGLTSTDGHEMSKYTNRFYTKLDSTLQFSLLSEEDLMTKVQEQTFKYFWDFGHPVSGLSRERNTSGDLVTSGGSGFGLMAILVGIERGFITRSEGIQRLEKMVTFLGQADRFHGAWSHWLNGASGNVIPFSMKDDGGDLVETSYTVMGLLTVRQYLDPMDAAEARLIQDINALWESVEWDWYRQGGQEALYWHWSPQYAWEKNHKISGYNEALITYILAAASPTHGVPASVYHQGWARNGAMVNGKNFFGIRLPLGNNDFGGPLFFEQYTFLGIDPRNLSDNYADYQEQTTNHTLINREHCIQNPNNFVGYGAGCWGLTASDSHQGYSAHSPTNDLGVITPTAALSSIPFTPQESMEALNHFYYYLGDRLWGPYGFYDAFNPTVGWTASSYLAIDQGPILLMIENHRSELLWDLFMSCPEVQAGLTTLGFTY